MCGRVCAGTCGRVDLWYRIENDRNGIRKASNEVKETVRYFKTSDKINVKNIPSII